jgi:predicted  nucleic acid-binding Zn-ribbon protein
MAEVEIGGATIKGGRLMLIIPLLSALGGGAWAGFEIYADYMDMKEIIQEIDIDEIRAENELVLTKLEDAIVYTRDIKNNLRDDLLKLEGYIDRMDGKVDKSNESIKETKNAIDETLEKILNEMNELQKDVTSSIREVEALNRETEKDVRDTMRETEDRINDEQKSMEARLNERLQEALDNPLSN